MQCISLEIVDCWDAIGTDLVVMYVMPTQFSNILSRMQAYVVEVVGHLLRRTLIYQIFHIYGMVCLFLWADV
jgi:hypothetical protein